MSIGVVFPAHAPAEDLPAFATRVEALGYDELWVVEDCFLAGGIALAATALAATERLRVGIGLLPAAVRNAAIVAMELATLARVHPARLTAAFGHGVEPWMVRVGARPSRRLAALDEVTLAVRTLLAGETVNAAGSHVELSSVALDAPPEVPPRILIGSTGPKGIALAGRRAEGLLLPEGSGPTFIADAKEVASRAVISPLPPPDIVVYAWLAIGDDEAARGRLRDAVTTWADSGLYPAPVRASGIAHPPPPGPIPRAIADELGVVGPAEACVPALARFFAAGADSVVLAALGAEYRDQYERFAAEALPGLASPGDHAA